MDIIIHSMSSLEIETTHSTSQEVEEVRRNWLELPQDVMSLILIKVGVIDILANAQGVCTSWRKLCKQPHLFRSIHLELTLLVGLGREAIDRSCGQLVEFSIQGIATDELLHYMSQRSSSLRCIRLVSCYYEVSDDGLIEMAKKLPQLEELEIIDCFFSKNVFEKVGRFCPQLKSCRVNYVKFTNAYNSFGEIDMFSEVPVAIAQNMPELRYLNLFGDILLTDDGLKAVLDGCPHLKSLDLRKCHSLKFAGDLKERCGNIEVIRFPNDPYDGFEYKNFVLDFSGI